MKFLMQKWGADQLLQSGYTGSVLVPLCDDMDEIRGELEADVKMLDTRSSKQNAAMHVYFKLLANTLNAAGLDIRKLYKPEVELPWRPDTVKEDIWRRVQIPVTGVKSTSSLTPNQVTEIYNIVSKHLSENHNINVSFPNRFGD